MKLNPLSTALLAALGLAVLVPKASACSSEPYIGAVCMYGRACPDKYLEMRGQVLSIADFTELYALIGNKFGGDDISTFALPKIAGRAISHAGTGPGLPEYDWGQEYGNRQMEIVNMPEHTHSIKAPAPTYNPNFQDTTVTLLGAPIRPKVTVSAGNGENATPLSGQYISAPRLTGTEIDPLFYTENHGHTVDLGGVSAKVSANIDVTEPVPTNRVGISRDARGYSGPRLALRFCVAVFGTMPIRK